MKRIVVSALAILVIAAVLFSGYLWWNKHNETKQIGTETEIALGDNVLGDLGANEESGSIEPILPGGEAPAPVEESAVDVAVSVEPAATDEVAVIDLSPEVETGPELPLPAGENGTRSLAPAEGPARETRPTGTTEVARPVVPEETPKVLVELEPTPATTSPVVEIPSTSVTVTQSQPTPIPTTPVVAPTSVPTVPAGNFAVSTLTPVVKAKLASVRNAMQRLGVKLQEQAAGSQHLQAHRVAVGYFRTKEEATSWATTNFKPKGVDFYVYPAQGMYSIQVGVYSQQQNAEKTMRNLHQKFPGWRLPVRTENTAITTTVYRLSIRGIPENLGRKIQDTLFQLGVQSELTGA